jgi:hypothetical protein
LEAPSAQEVSRRLDGLFLQRFRLPYFNALGVLYEKVTLADVKVVARHWSVLISVAATLGDLA